MKKLVPKNSNDKFDNLNDRDSSVNILKDQEFAKSRENRPQATREHGSRRKSLLEQGLFGDHEPEVLQKTVWWVIALHFGFSARDESRILKWAIRVLTKIQKPTIKFLFGMQKEAPKHTMVTVNINEHLTPPLKQQIQI